jgi:ribosomal protein S20
MTEKDTAIWMANKALEVPNADPDDELRTISRQFLRSIEQLKQERNKAINEMLTKLDRGYKDYVWYKHLRQEIESLKSDSK